MRKRRHLLLFTVRFTLSYYVQLPAAFRDEFGPGRSGVLFIVLDVKRLHFILGPKGKRRFTILRFEWEVRGEFYPMLCLAFVFIPILCGFPCLP